MQTIWSFLEVGKSNTPKGVYQIIATLQLLYHWTQTIYRPWFEANALTLTPEQKAALVPSGPAATLVEGSAADSNRDALRM